LAHPKSIVIDGTTCSNLSAMAEYQIPNFKCTTSKD
jgi:hypothetical protein